MLRAEVTSIKPTSIRMRTPTSAQRGAIEVAAPFMMNLKGSYASQMYVFALQQRRGRRRP